MLKRLEKIGVGRMSRRSRSARQLQETRCPARDSGFSLTIKADTHKDVDALVTCKTKVDTHTFVSAYFHFTGAMAFAMPLFSFPVTRDLDQKYSSAQ